MKGLHSFSHVFLNARVVSGQFRGCKWLSFQAEIFFAVSTVKGKMMKSSDNKCDVKGISILTRQGIENLK